MPDTLPCLTALPPLDLRKGKLSKEMVLQYFHNCWESTALLFSSVKEQDTLHTRPDKLRNPLIFYIGHSAAFYANKLRKVNLLEEDVCSSYQKLFAIGVDPHDSSELEVVSDWPTLNDVNKFLDKIFIMVNIVIEKMPFGPDFEIDSQSPYWALIMAFEHERIHFETSAVLIRQLNVDLVEKPSKWPDYAPSFGQPVENRLMGITSGTVTLGKSNGTLFGWDNEYGQKTVDVPAFQVSQNLISNWEYSKFMESGEYKRDTHWTNEGLKWRNKAGVWHPIFWVPQLDGSFKYRAMFDEIAMPLDFPVEVNYHEAEAYLSWIGNGARFITEAEFHLISKQQGYNDSIDSEANLHFKYGSSTPVGMHQNGQKDRVNDLWGNVSDWIGDEFYPLPGFKPHFLYPDFAEPFMDSQHNIQLGGSWISTGTTASRFYRNWFRRHFFTFVGFRIARSGNSITETSKNVEN